MDSWWYFPGNKERKSVSESGRSSGLMVSEESSSLVADSSSRDWDSSSSIDLKLGNGEKSSESSISSSDKKRVKPFCLVYGCAKDLTSSKDYYKRHKVCEIHSKTVKVIVNGIEQRFCQQCSRFHILAEFDNTKRSCRKRLAGHNERRRKPCLGTLNSLGRVQDYNGPWFEDFTSIPSTLWQDTFLHQHKKFKVDSWNGAVPVEPNATLISPRQQQFPFHSSTIGAPNIDNVNDLPIENDFMYHNTYKSSHDSAGLKCSAQSSSFQAPSEPENSGCALYLLSTPSLKSANPPSKHPTAAGHKEGNCLPPFPISNVVDKVHNGVQGTMDCIIAHDHD